VLLALKLSVVDYKHSDSKAKRQHLVIVNPLRLLISDEAMFKRLRVNR